ncbi:hypothetical protein HDE_13625 [Halotydeus destructor]|nr:hypothetical protein HDE_13625 [Halotydeus destructor]
MSTSVVLFLIVLTATSGQPQSKYHISRYTTEGDKELYEFNPNLAETFPEAQRLCALYGGHIAEPKGHHDRERLLFLGEYWINSYFDERTSTWRWLSDQSLVDTHFFYGVTKPKCRGDECANYRQYVTHLTDFGVYEYQFMTTDVRKQMPTKVGVACERTVA